MRNVLLTGCMGFVGSHIALHLQSKGFNVIGIDDMSGGDYANITNKDGKSPLGSVYVRDCNDRKDMLDIMQYHSVDTLVHFAANARESASQFQPSIVTNRNLGAYAATLSAAIEAGVENVIVASSIAIYGHQTPPFTEEMPPMPQDVYAINKTAMEQMTRVMATVHGFNYVILRPYNIFGVKQRLSDRYRNVIGIWMNKIMRDEPIQIFGDGKQRRAFTCIDDIVVPISSIIANCQRFNGQVYNIGGFEDISLNDLAGRVCMNMGAPNQKIIHVEDRPQEVKYAYSSPEKAVRDLHFRIEKGIDKGLYEMSQWALSKGPQEWVNNDPMEINSEKMPSVWR